LRRIKQAKCIVHHKLQQRNAVWLFGFDRHRARTRAGAHIDRRQWFDRGVQVNRNLNRRADDDAVTATGFAATVLAPYVRCTRAARIRASERIRQKGESVAAGRCELEGAGSNETGALGGHCEFAKAGRAICGYPAWGEVIRKHASKLKLTLWLMRASPSNHRSERWWSPAHTLVSLDNAGVWACVRACICLPCWDFGRD
jgi:hypothetical protein